MRRRRVISYILVIYNSRNEGTHNYHKSQHPGGGLFCNSQPLLLQTNRRLSLSILYPFGKVGVVISSQNVPCEKLALTLVHGTQLTEHPSIRLLGLQIVLSQQ